MARDGFDLACLWDKWALYDPPERPFALKTMIHRAMRIGVNVIAYATGREPPNKLDPLEFSSQKGDLRIQRGMLEVVKLVHNGAWDAAPRALRNLLMDLNRLTGPTASTRHQNLSAADPNLFKYPIAYMHGRSGFTLSKQETDQLRKYLTERTGVLFADACCGSEAFDRSFREMIEQAFPGRRLERIPVSHELFSEKIGFDLRRVRRRSPEPSGADEKLQAAEREVEPFLEGIEIDGRYVVIYSKYDISCALERQSSIACSGYVEKDAMRIGINVLLYAMLQDVSWREMIERDVQ